MRILFLGTGTSTGVPTLCCECAVCQSDDPRNNRLRSSIMVENEGYQILIDTSTDLRQQCLRHRITHIDSILYSHHHADHVNGIDELRCFNFFNKTVTPCYGSEMTLSAIKKNFSYIFNGSQPQGGGIPQIEMVTVNSEPFTLGKIKITPVDIRHGNLTILGYRLNDSAYITDCSGIPDASRKKLLDLDLLILNALGFKPHPTHFCLDQALAAIANLKPKRAILTHINHNFDHEKVSAELPENVELAYDGMTVDL